MSSLIIHLVFYFPVLMDLIMVHVVLVQKREKFYVDALVATHVCFIMVFVSHVDMTFSWMVSTPAVR
jgi:hypothetical protein